MIRLDRQARLKTQATGEETCTAYYVKQKTQQFCVHICMHGMLLKEEEMQRENAI